MFSLLLASPTGLARAETVADLTSPYHHIRIEDQGGMRILSFDGSMESRMQLDDPLRGHFEYTEFFHMPWLWHSNMASVLMVGLGGASTQRAFAHDYPDMTIETVELDPMVATLARQYFHYQTTPRQQVWESDGRMFMRRTQKRYDLIIMDAYSHNRYGSYLPHHLATREFFVLAGSRLSTNGVLCYNVMGTLQGRESKAVGSVYNTLKAVFPQVYSFSVIESHNVILLATWNTKKTTFNDLLQRAGVLKDAGRIRRSGFTDRLYQFRGDPPVSSVGAPVLTDDFAPVDGLLQPQPVEAR